MHHPNPPGRTRRWLTVATIAAVMTVLAVTPAFAQVATLGTPPPDSDASPAPAQSLGEQDAMLAWAECMRDNGIEVTDPVFDVAGNLVGGLDFGEADGAGPKDAKGGEYLAASQACDSLLIAFKPEADPALQQEQTEAALEFAVCMREQGLDWPDPAPEGSKFADAEIKVDKESAEFQAAFEACDDELAVDDEGGADT